MRGGSGGAGRAVQIERRADRRFADAEPFELLEPRELCRHVRETLLAGSPAAERFACVVPCEQCPLP